MCVEAFGAGIWSTNVLQMGQRSSEVICFLLLLRNGGVNSACVSDGFALLMFMPSLARLPVCTGLFKFNALLSSSLKEVGAV